MLRVRRRHTKACPYRGKKNVPLNKCACPLWARGTVTGTPIRKTLDTINIELAHRKARQLEDEITTGKVRKAVADAADAFLVTRSIERSTMTKYRRIMARLVEFAGAEGIATIDRFRLDQLDEYRRGRAICELSWQKELQLLRTFFDFCRKRKWCEENIAREMEMPKDPQPKPREPYTQAEIIAIFAACDSFGKGAYERSRAKAMILLMRYYGLRVSDVATLERARVSETEIRLYTQKNGKPVAHELYPVVREALDALPLPKGASVDCPYFFWTGQGDRHGHIKTVDRTLQAVFRKSGVKGAIAHRFRHTLATEILVNGGTTEDAANVLGDSPAIISKHYAKVSKQYQHRLQTLLRRVHFGPSGTPPAHEEMEGAKAFNLLGQKLVLEVGVEPT